MMNKVFILNYFMLVMYFKKQMCVFNDWLHGQVGDHDYDRVFFDLINVSKCNSFLNKSLSMI